MDMRTLVSALEKRPDVTLKRGSKHMRVMTLDGRQLAVISRGAQSNKGRDAKNILATLRREGIELEGDKMAVVTNGEIPSRFADPARVTAIAEVGQTVMDKLGIGKTALADRLYELQDKVIVGGTKYGGEGSVRETVYRLYRNGGEKAGLSVWGAEVLEEGLRVLIDEAAEKEREEYVASAGVAAEKAAEEEKAEAEAVNGHVYHGRVVIESAVIDGQRVASFVEEELEQARLTVESVLAYSAKVREVQTSERFPFGKGTMVQMARITLAHADARGYQIQESSGASNPIDLVLAQRLSSFVHAKNYPLAKTHDDMLWIAGLWNELMANYGMAEAFVVNPRTAAGDQIKRMVDAAVPTKPWDDDWNDDAPVDEAVEEPVEAPFVYVPPVDDTPLHIRVLAALIDGTSTKKAMALAVEVLNLEQRG